MCEDMYESVLNGVKRKFRRVHATYTLEFASIAAAGTGTKNRQIQSDAEGGFMVDQIAADVRVGDAVGGYTAGKVVAVRDPFQSADDTAHLPLLGNVFAQIAVANIVWNYDRIPLTHITGTGHNPAILPTRPHIKANSTLIVQIWNETENAILPVISFIGFKLYPID